MREWGKNNGLWITTILYIISVASYNSLGASITKYVSATASSTLSSARTALIWAYFVISPGPGHEKFIWLELVGFLILILGTFVFNEVLVIPFLGFNRYTQKNLKNGLKQEEVYSKRSFGNDTLYESIQGNSSDTR